MGLRERKAARTREHIVDVAIDLFAAQGYDQTTMEQIAEQAEVAPSTLYRYFTSKDLLVLDRLLTFTDLGSALRARPHSESVRESLTAVIRDSLESFVVGPRTSALRRIIEESAGPRARLGVIATEARISIEEALADRLTLAPDDLRVTLTARIALQIYEVAAERWWSGDHSVARSDVLSEVLSALAELDVLCAHTAVDA